MTKLKVSKLIKTLFKFLTSIFVVIVLGVFVSYFVSYGPHHSQLKNAITDSKSKLVGNSTQLYQLAIAAESKEGIGWRVARGSFYEHSYSKLEKRSKAVWHLYQILWYSAINFHFSEEEIFYLWCHYAFSGKSKDINSISLKYFDKPILELGVREQAQIVGMPHGPSVYIPGTERGNRRLEWVLKQYASNQQ